MLTLIIIVDQALACLYSFVSEFLTFGKEAKEEEDMQQRADKESSSETDVSCYTGSLDTQSPDGTQSVTISDTMPTATVFCWLCGPSQMTWTKGVQEAISSLPLAEEDCEVFKAMAVGKPKCHAIKGSDGGKLLSSLETIQPGMAVMTCAGRIKLAYLSRCLTKSNMPLRGHFFLHETYPHLMGWKPCILILSKRSVLRHARLSKNSNAKLVVVVHNQNLHVLLISTATIEAGMEVTLPLSCRYRKRTDAFRRS